MQEIKSHRTRDSKTFQKDDGSYRTTVYNEAVHYQTDDGEWKEVDTQPTVATDSIGFQHLPYEVEVDRESWCGELHLFTDDYKITANIIPVYGDGEEVINEPLTADYDPTCDECCVGQQAHTDAHWDYVIQNGRAKIEAEFESATAVPRWFQFVIQYEGLNAVESEDKHTRIVEENSEIVKTHEHPKEILFDHDGDTAWRFKEPFFLNPDGEKRHKPLRVESHANGRIVGKFKSPATEWVQNAIDDGPLILDPDFSYSESVDDGDTQTYTPPEQDIEISNVEVRWVGSSTTSTSTTTTEHKEANGIGGVYSGTLTEDVVIPEPSDDADSGSVQRYWEVEEGGFGTIDIETIYVDGDEVPFIPWSSGVTKSGGETKEFKVVPEQESGDYHLRWARIVVEWTETTTTTTTHVTESPSVSTSTGSAEGPSSLSDDSTSSWQNAPELIGDRENELNHSISGSEEADFEFRYDWESINLPTPGNVNAEVN